MAGRPKTPYLYVVEDRGYETPCWVWTRAANSAGYGVRRRAGALVLAHRAAYEEEVGPIPEGLELDHLCEVRLCVRPSHLEAVTHAENLRRGAKSKLSMEAADAIRKQFASGVVAREIAAEHGVHIDTVRRVRYGTRWAA